MGLTRRKRCLIVGGTGYIGSRLFLHLRERYEVETVDLEWYGNRVNPANLRIDVRHAGAEVFAPFEVIVLLAGHSSVGMAEGAFSACFENNVVNFDRVMRKLRRGQKLIYASSASVYGSRDGVLLAESDPVFTPNTPYDISKHMIDVMAPQYGIEYYGLRFGTVCGFSPLLRTDVIVNSMVESAARDGRVVSFNRSASRSLLGLGDLCRAVERIIECGEDRRGIYNLASLSASVGEIASCVAGLLGAEDVTAADAAVTPYCFRLDTALFRSRFSFDFHDDVASMVAELTARRREATPTQRREPLAYVPSP